jgi:hypothetical protein
MEVYGRIASKIREIAGRGGSGAMAVFPAQVVRVVGEVCTVDLDGLKLSDVRLRAVVNGAEDHLLIVPQTDSYVLVVDLSGGDFRQLAVIAYSEIDSVNIKIGDTTLDVNGEGVVFNGGALGGLVKIKELEDNLESLKSYCEALKSAVGTGLNGVGAGTAASGTLGKTAFDTAMAGKAISFGSMENEGVKQ